MKPLHSEKKYLYLRVGDAIREQLLAGTFSIGDRLPAVRELSERFQCNYQTIRKSLRQLSAEGYLELRHGSGVFVKAGSRFLPHSGQELARCTLAVVSRPLQNLSDLRFMEHLHLQLERRGFHLEQYTTNDFAVPEKIFDRIALRGCFAVLLPFLRISDPIDDIAACIDRYDFPIVFATPFPGLEQNSCIAPEIFGVATRNALKAFVRYFQAIGRRRIILMLPAEEAAGTIWANIDGYMEGCRTTGISCEMLTVTRFCNAMPAALERFGLSSDPECAVLCYDDDLAIRLISAAQQKNISIPEKLAVAGLGSEISAMASPIPLTSIRFPYDIVAFAMLRHAVAMANGHRAPQTVSHWQEIIPRESCGGIRLFGRQYIRELLCRIRREIMQDASPPRLFAQCCKNRTANPIDKEKP